jgi:hypothetical protein
VGGYRHSAPDADHPGVVSMGSKAAVPEFRYHPGLELFLYCLGGSGLSRAHGRCGMADCAPSQQYRQAVDSTTGVAPSLTGVATVSGNRAHFLDTSVVRLMLLGTKAYQQYFENQFSDRPRYISSYVQMETWQSYLRNIIEFHTREVSEER